MSQLEIEEEIRDTIEFINYKAEEKAELDRFLSPYWGASKAVRSAIALSYSGHAEGIQGEPCVYAYGREGLVERLPMYRELNNLAGVYGPSLIQRREVNRDIINAVRTLKALRKTASRKPEKAPRKGRQLAMVL